MTTPAKLYKRDSNGDVRIWLAEAIGETYVAQSGKQGGKMNVSKPTTCKPKNVGRANATTAEEQAKIEVSALYTKKVKEGYRYDISEIDNVDNINPMLAEKYDDHVGKHNWPIFSQPKLDGFRCNNKLDGGIWSRENEQFFSCPHIEEAITTIGKETGVIFDGELYNHDLKDDFDELQSLIMTRSPSKLTEEHFAKTEAIVQYHIYDIVDPTRTFQERILKLNEVFSLYPDVAKYCRLVPTKTASNLEELNELYEEYLAAGYEGQMVRGDALYQQNKRSKHLLKRKEFADEEFEIVEVVEGLGNRSGMAGRVTCKLADGRTFGAGIKGGVKYYKKLWEQKEELVGKQATIQMFKQKTPDGMPRFPVFKAVRD